VTVTVNGVVKAKKSNRGFTVVSSQCDYTFEYEIDLEPGQNEIKAIVKNAGGTTTTDARRVTLNKSDNVSSEKRLALIIGNGAYQYIGALNNPSNDARLMGETLGSLGFETMVYTDLSQNEMISKIREFGNKLTEEKAVGLFFYAGHGLQVNGENYLVPITANITKQQDVELECVNLKRVLGEMEYAQNDLNIIILDACRNNPFANMRAINSGGLAAVNAPRGTFIAFATSPGNVASDGSGSNGLYTEQLAQEITQPGIKIEDVFKKVRSRVYEISQQQQIPWENSSIFGDFYFKK
ncbi:MAG: caspase family protein, partial [Bacteroidales bacterium]|nr:caspase family protein [Bacteroidales bacterium]